MVSVTRSTEVQAHGLELLREELGLPAAMAKSLDHRQTVFAGQLRRGSTPAPARYILRLPCGEVLSGEFGKMRPPPATAARRSCRRGATSALLAERLLGAVMDLRAVLLLHAVAGGRWPDRPRPPGAQRLVEIATEQRIRASTVAAAWLCIVQELEFHVFPCSGLRSP